jgi:hypothetical protein
MDLSTYFETRKGIGVLATTDGNGKVNAALYARPRIKNKDKCLFIMSDKLTHKNIQENPYACYLFKENDSYQGTRLVLKKIDETQDKETISHYLQERDTDKKYSNDSGKTLFAVIFKIEKTIPLIGDKS